MARPQAKQRARDELKSYLRKLKNTYLASRHPSMQMIIAFRSAADGLFAVPFYFTIFFVGLWLAGYDDFQKLAYFILFMGLGGLLYLGMSSLKGTESQLSEFVYDLEDLVISEKRIQYLLLKSGLPTKRSLRLGRKILKRVKREAARSFESNDFIDSENPVV